MKSRFGLWITALLCPPLYFVRRRKWVCATVHSFIYLIAMVTALLGIGVLFWAVGFIHAFWDLQVLIREDFVTRQAEVMAQKLTQAN